MFEKPKRIQDFKNRITPPGSPFFQDAKVLRLQNPKDPKNGIIYFQIFTWSIKNCCCCTVEEYCSLETVVSGYNTGWSTQYHL